MHMDCLTDINQFQPLMIYHDAITVFYLWIVHKDRFHMISVFCFFFTFTVLIKINTDISLQKMMSVELAHKHMCLKGVCITTRLS